MNRTIVVVVGAVLLAVLAAAGGFLYGTRVGEARATAARAEFFAERGGGQFGQAPGFLGAQGGQFPQAGEAQGGLGRGGVTGEVAGVHGDTLTVTGPEGAVQVLVNEQTTIRKVTTLRLDELQPGEQVVVIGDRDPQGNLVARSVQVGAAAAFRPAP